uniref:Uncharacterized protein n=1 Tax=Magallana gigas TaxID=29159 RepID=A0A8W8JFT3_MAGGI
MRKSTDLTKLRSAKRGKQSQDTSVPQSSSPSTISPEILETITKEVTEKVTANPKEGISNMFNALQPTAITSQGSIACASSTYSNINRDNAIQETVEAAIVNQSDKITSGRSSSGFVSTSVSIEARVPDKLKSKIWSKQYVDCGSLLLRNKQGKEKLPLQVENSMRTGSLTIHQVEREDTDGELSSMNDWVTAWNRYMTIYCIKYPHEQAKLAKNLEAVRDIADAKGNWYSYDKDFRSLIEQGHVQWGDVHMELYVNTRLTSSQSIKTTNPHKELSKTIPRGACFQFHTGKQCNAGLSCRFQQRCYNCGGSHPFIRCTKRVQRPYRVLQKFKYSHHNQPNSSIRLGHPLLPSKGPTTIKPKRPGYDETDTNYLMNGFSLSFVGECHGVESQNLRSALIVRI